VTLGIKPTRPETGYGYIQANLALQSVRNKEIYEVETFKEKPNLETAVKYVKNNNFFWNAGIFIWNLHTIVNAFRMYQPSMNRVFESIADAYGTEREQELINQNYPNCENISIDYAIMEKAEEIYVYPCDFGWSDLGTWGSLAQLSHKDGNGNSLISPNVKTFETSNCIVNVDGAKQVVVQGLDGYIVAERDGRLLICKISEEQRIKEFSAD
jgi:mannose-1-phosphate guanylyltransferase